MNHTLMYITVDVSTTLRGMEFGCWMSPDKPNVWERPFYPHTYNYEANLCKWKIRSNIEMTEKQLRMVTEYADKLCADTQRENDRRLPVNRK